MVLLMVINSTDDEEEQDWSEGGYEDNLSATYGSVAAAPTIPTADSPSLIPNVSPPAPSAPAPQTGPPVPAAGLPDGWNMEQWQHYGQQWLDSQK